MSHHHDEPALYQSGRLVISVALFGLLLSSACGSGDRAGSRQIVVDGRKVFELEQAECDDDGSCQPAFVVDGVTFLVPDCASPLIPSDLGEVFAVGRDDGPVEEARALAGRDPREVLAVRPAGGPGCSVNGGWFATQAQD